MLSAFACQFPGKEVMMMLDFLKWTEGMHLSVTVPILLCIISQTLSLIMSYYRRPQKQNLTHTLESALELFILFVIFIFSLMHGHMVMVRHKTMFAAPQFHCCRIGIVLLLLATALWICALKKSSRPLLPALPALVLLPIAETVLGNAYPWMFAFALIIYLLRSTYISLMQYKKLRTGLSAFAVKNAMDTLPSGVLFCEKDGHILLINQCMQNLMVALTGKVHRNGLNFYDSLPSQSLDEDIDCDKGSVICLDSDETAWMFSKWTFTLNRKTYTQISAADVTLQWRLTRELKRQNNLLALKSEELKETIASLHVLSRKKEIQTARVRAHDILGNRLSLILRSLHSDDIANPTILAAQIGSMLDDMKKNTMQSTAKDDLASLRKTFFSIGVHIHFQGDLPDHPKIGIIFAEIIREAVTNAVRHGFATEISVHLQTSEDSYFLDITDNGSFVLDGVCEGDGLSGIRKRVTALNGKLNITPLPHFTILVTIPKEEMDV